MKLKEFKKYLKVYFLFTHAAFAQVLITRFSSIIFIVGKVTRFLFSLFLILLIIGKTQGVVGYTLPQAVLFFLIFNLIDIVVQALLRGVYWFRGTIISGNFDFYLLKPLNTLFRSLFCHTDFLDIITLIPLITFSLNYILKNSLIANMQSFFLFLLLFFNGCILALSFHIIVIAIGVLTTEVDHMIWIYRDLSGMLKLPLEIYNQPIRIFLTFIIPMAVIFTFPTKAIMGILSWQWAVYSFLCSIFCILCSLKFWHFALTKYSSASS